MRSLLRGAVAALVVAAAALGPAAGAGAQVTIGQLAPAVPPTECGGEKIDIFQTALQSGNSYRITGDGVITSWSTQAGMGPAQSLEFKVFRELDDPGRYTVVGHDSARSLTAQVVNTFKVRIPVRSGDVIGINGDSVGNTACFFRSGNQLDAIGLVAGNQADGGEVDLQAPVPEARVNVSATLLKAPILTAIAPQVGPIAGGTRVVVSGENLEEVQSVSFGSAPASFTPESEGQLTAVAPRRSGPGATTITVTTAAGSAGAPEPFTYEACAVPRLGGKTLAAAKASLRRALCGLGRVKSVRASRRSHGKIVKQAPKPGSLLAPSAKVSLSVGK